MHRFVVAILFAFLTLPAAQSVAADTAVAAPFAAMHWRCIGPFRGGRTVAVTGVPDDPERFYFGAVGGGIWRTDNAGSTWRPVFDAAGVASIGAIAVAPSNPNVVYAGSGEADFRSDLQQGKGMYKSLDAGQTWQPIGLADTRAIGRISVNPHDENDVVVAALGHPYGPNAERGIFHSTDGGTSWRKTLFSNNDTGAISVTRDPQHPMTLFAAMLQTRRPPWNVYPPSKGPSSGLYASSDGGNRWRALHGNGFPTAGLGRIGIAVAPSDSARVYAIVDAKDGGLYRSDDAGIHWKNVANEKRLWGRGWYFEEVAVDPRNADTVYVSNTSVYRSTDGGTSFSALKGAPGGDDYHMLWIDPSAPDRMILASDQGAVVSVDGARTWSSWYNQPTAQLYHVATDSRFPFWVYGAQQDSGAIAVASRSLRRGIMDADTMPLDIGGESDTIAPDPLHAGVLYGSRVAREDLATHSVRALSPTLARTGAWRDTWTLPAIFSPLDPRVLYFSHQVLFRTGDGGNSWNAISPDLTRASPGIPPNLDSPTANDIEDPKTARRGVIYTIAPSSVQRGTIWVGTDDGNIQLTRNEGHSWTDVTPAGLPAWSKVGIVEASHFSADEAYAAVDRHRLDDGHPYIYRTRDGGKNWREIKRGIPAGSFINVVREDPVRRGLLYAGTETGVFVSFDDGDTWQSLQLDLPVASVRDISVRDDALAIATHGRSFWILDDLTLLRQWNTGIAAAPAWLFEPQAAFRLRRASDEGTPFPPETPAGENPPDGAIVDYTLQTATTVQLDISDAHGDVVRHWSSDDAQPRVDPKALQFPAFWVPQVPILSGAAGPHRFVWDLHYATTLPASADALDDPFAVRGIWAAPGIYRLRLTAGTTTIDRTLTLKLDPHETASPADLREQFSFARALERMRLRLQTALHGRPPGTERQHLSDIDAALATLEAAEQSAPAAPSAEERQAFQMQQTEVAAALHVP